MYPTPIDALGAILALGVIFVLIIIYFILDERKQKKEKEKVRLLGEKVRNLEKQKD